MVRLPRQCSRKKRKIPAFSRYSFFRHRFFIIFPRNVFSHPPSFQVWQSNMYDAFQQVRQIVRQYPFVSMDTEFPGVVARPIGEFNTTSDYQYQVIRKNEKRTQSSGKKNTHIFDGPFWCFILTAGSFFFLSKVKFKSGYEGSNLAQVHFSMFE